MPAGVVTVTRTVPLDSGGDTAVIEVGESIVKAIALVAPNVTAVARPRF